jgi:hypothetical protein
MGVLKYAVAGAVKGLGDAIIENGKTKREAALADKKIAADTALETQRQAGTWLW